MNLQESALFWNHSVTLIMSITKTYIVIWFQLFLLRKADHVSKDNEVISQTNNQLTPANVMLCNMLHCTLLWIQVQNGLSSNWTYFYLYFDLSRHLHCLLCVLCMNQWSSLDHVMIRMCSIFGIHTIVTMVCYGICLSLILVLDIANSLYFNNIPYI